MADWRSDSPISDKCRAGGVTSACILLQPAHVCDWPLSQSGALRREGAGRQPAFCYSWCSWRTRGWRWLRSSYRSTKCSIPPPPCPCSAPLPLLGWRRLPTGRCRLPCLPQWSWAWPWSTPLSTPCSSSSCTCSSGWSCTTSTSASVTRLCFCFSVCYGPAWGLPCFRFTLKIVSKPINWSLCLTGCCIVSLYVCSSSPCVC